MTNEEAKFMLQGYRPNGQDADNEAFAEALAQAERDPSLRAWFEREQAFDALIAGKLREVRAPDGLRESILAGTKLSTQPVAAERTPAWWRGAWGVALAAAAATPANDHRLPSIQLLAKGRGAKLGAEFTILGPASVQPRCPSLPGQAQRLGPTVRVHHHGAAARFFQLHVPQRHLLVLA